MGAQEYLKHMVQAYWLKLHVNEYVDINTSQNKKVIIVLSSIKAGMTLSEWPNRGVQCLVHQD